MYPLVLRAAGLRCVHACIIAIVSMVLLESPLWALCSAGIVTTDTATGQIDWSANETTCVANPADCNGRDPETGPDGTQFTFRVKYTESNTGSPPQAMYLFIDTNGDGSYPCTPAQAGGSIGSLDDSASPVGPGWLGPALGVLLLGMALAATHLARARRLRLAACVGLAVVAAIGCGGGGGSAGAGSGDSGCAKAEAYNLLALSTTFGSGADIGRQLKLCGNSRTVLYIFFVVNSLGSRIGGPAQPEQSMSTE